MSLEVKLKMSYKQEKSMKKLYGKLQGRQIACERQLVKLMKNTYAQPERPNPEAIDSAWIKWGDLEPPVDVKGIFIKFDDGRIWTDAHYRGSDEYRMKTVGSAKPVSWTFMERSPPREKSRLC